MLSHTSMFRALVLFAGCLAGAVSVASVTPRRSSAQSSPYAVFDTDRSRPSTAEIPDEDGWSEDDLRRRSRVAARFGGIEITVGELEDRLAESDAVERRDIVDSPRRLRRLTRELVRARLLSREAERRGLERDRRVHAARQRILVEILRERDFGIERFAQQNVTATHEPARRRAVVFSADTSRALRPLRDGEAHDYRYWLAQLDEHPEARDTGWIARSESDLAPEVIEALFTAPTNRPEMVEAAGRHWLVVVLGERLPQTRGSDELAVQRAQVARGAAWAELIRRLRDTHVRRVDVDALRALTLPHAENPDEE